MATNATNIKNMGFPDHVRAKPSLYIGPLGSDGCLTILREIMDNVVDEALAGRASAMIVHKVGAGHYVVCDDGGGISTDLIEVQDLLGKKHRVPALRAAVGMLNSSGKFDDKSYATSRGSHGIGQKATNALSLKFSVWTYWKNSWYETHYEKGKETVSVKKAGCAPKNPATGKPQVKGTQVEFVIDKSIFKTDVIDIAKLRLWAKMAAYFTPKFRIALSGFSKKPLVFHEPAGPVAYADSAVESLGAQNLTERGKPFVHSTALADCVVRFTNHPEEAFTAFTNGLDNRDGGVHVGAFYAALRTSLQPFLKRNGNLTVNDLKDGIVGLINAKLSHPGFSSQDKVKLVDARAAKPLQDELTESFRKFWTANKSLGKAVVEQALAAAALKERFRLDKAAARQLNKVKKLGLPAKAVVASAYPPSQRELYILEGDSATGTARSARLPWQELLPMRGKPPNAMRAKGPAVLGNSEVMNILTMLGYNPNAKEDQDPLAKMRVSRIIFLSDADIDGPLPGNTKIAVRLPGSEDPVVMTMRELATPSMQNKTYEVLSWNGQSAVWAQATNCRLMEVSSEYMRLTFESGLTQLCSLRHKWCQSMPTDTAINMDESEITANGMLLKMASNIRAGDKILRLVQTEEDGPAAVLRSQDLTGISNMSLIEDTVVEAKMRTGKQEHAFYCLTVRGFHTFALANGLMSSNCHINALLLTLLVRFAPQLFERGHVYVAQTSQYYNYDAKKDLFVTGATSDEVLSASKKAGIKPAAHHIKGWGEVDPPLLRRMAFDPETRNVAQIQSWGNDKEAAEFRMLMGSDTSFRKQLLGI